MNQNQYWSKVEKFKLSCNDIPDTVVRLRSGLEYIKQQKYDGVVALTASILQNELSGENSWVKKCDIANLLVDTYRSRGTVYKAIAETAEVLQWTPKFANGKYPFAFQPKYYEEDNSGYIDLNKYEIESLFSIVQLCSGERHYTKKESDAIKLYLYLKSDIRIKNGGARSRWYRRYSITGDYGLAATLGFKPSYDRGIKTALSLLEEVGLLTYTSDVVAPNKAGKCLVVNAMMCDKENFWYSADYQSKNRKQGFSIFKQGPQSPTSMSADSVANAPSSAMAIGNNNEDIDYNNNEDIQDSGPMSPSSAESYSSVNSGQDSVIEDPIYRKIVPQRNVPGRNPVTLNLWSIFEEILDLTKDTMLPESLATYQALGQVEALQFQSDIMREVERNGIEFTEEVRNFLRRKMHI